MRRGKLTPQSIFFIVLAGFFTLSSYFLDQRVIIKEDEIRDVNFLLEKKYQKLEEESSNAENLTYLSNRVAIETHQNNSISTINYKFHLFIKNNREVVENFDKEKLIRVIRANLFTGYLNTRSNIFDLKLTIDDMAFSKTDYDNLDLRNKVNSLFTWDDTFIKKNEKVYFTNNYIKSVYAGDITVDEGLLRELYVEAVKLNKELYSNYKILDELSDYFFEKEEKLQDEYDILVVKQSKIKIQKNYFILLSILFQILALLSFLLLFRNFIIRTFNK